MSKWQSTLLFGDALLNDAIKNLETSGLQIALAVTDTNNLIGTVTDGDIRRALLQGLTLTSPIDQIINRDPLVVPPSMARETVLELMRANKVHQLPVVDESRRVVGLHLWNNLVSIEPRENSIVIMAGGKGTRLRPHTEICPKPLLPVGGKPILEHIVLRAKSSGFQNFVIAIHHLGNMISDYFGDGHNWDVRIEYVRETSPLGTAGALGLLEPRPARPFVVSNGDVLSNINFAELVDFHRNNGAIATMAVRLHEWQNPFGVVQTRGIDIVGFEEKPVIRSHVNAGVYVLEPIALDALAADEACDMPELFDRLQKQRHRTIVYPLHENWLDVGQADDLARAHKMDLVKESLK